MKTTNKIITLNIITDARVVYDKRLGTFFKKGIYKIGVGIEQYIDYISDKIKIDDLKFYKDGNPLGRFKSSKYRCLVNIVPSVYIQHVNKLYYKCIFEGEYSSIGMDDMEFNRKLICVNTKDAIAVEEHKSFLPTRFMLTHSNTGTAKMSRFTKLAGAGLCQKKEFYKGIKINKRIPRPYITLLLDIDMGTLNMPAPKEIVGVELIPGIDTNDKFLIVDAGVSSAEVLSHTALSNGSSVVVALPSTGLDDPLKKKAEKTFNLLPVNKD